MGPNSAKAGVQPKAIAMTIISRPTTPIKPAAIYAYFDKIQFWVRTPLDRATLATLNQQCGRGGIFVGNRPAKFKGGFRQRIELRQPSSEALLSLARRDDVLINRAEIAIDYIYKRPAETEGAFEFLHRHFVRRWHGKKQKIKLVRGDRSNAANRRAAEVVDDVGAAESRYDAGRAPNKIVFYSKPYSRVTGELNCLHLEWHLNGSRAVQRAGIKSGRDLLEFDHRLFWQKRLLLYRVDPERLGRLIRNRSQGKKSRTSEFVKSEFKYNIDANTGSVHVRACDTIQELIDELKGSHRIRRALVPISNEVLLPE